MADSLGLGFKHGNKVRKRLDRRVQQVVGGWLLRRG
jgi:hypothetical protein